MAAQPIPHHVRFYASAIDRVNAWPPPNSGARLPCNMPSGRSTCLTYLTRSYRADLRGEAKNQDNGRDGYLPAFEAATNDAVAKGFLLADDAPEIKALAAASLEARVP